MTVNAWLTEAEAAERLTITIRTLRTRMAEAGVRGVKPGRTRLLSETDFEKLVAYLGQRANKLTLRTPPGVPVEVRRTLARSDTQRLLKKVQRPVVKLDMEQGPRNAGSGPVC